MVPVTVYVVVTVGVAFTGVPVVALKAVDGDHAYVVAPLAIRFTFPPGHIVGDPGATLTVGVGVTVIVTVCVAMQPLALVPVTVYVFVVVGFAVTAAPVVALKPTAGFQVYVVAPPAVNPTEPPEQNVVGPDGIIETMGIGLTVTTTV